MIVIGGTVLYGLNDDASRQDQHQRHARSKNTRPHSSPLNVADDIPVSNLSTEKLGPAFRWRDGLFVQEFDSEITLCWKVLKAQAKFYGREAGIRTRLACRRVSVARRDMKCHVLVHASAYSSK